LRFDHLAAAPLRVVLVTELTQGMHYELTPSTGTIRELVEFGSGRAVLVNYAAPFRMPNVHPAPWNDSPDLGLAAGEWTGLPLVPGTYTLTLRAWYEEVVNFALENNPYSIAAEAQSVNLLVGGATVEEPYDLVRAESCHACHQELRYHDGQARGLSACLACHGTAAAEDRPPYVAANAPPTPGVSVSFRNLLHRIHSGGGLEGGEDFQVVGAANTPWPDNFSTNEFRDLRFPAQPGGAQQCTKCHGAESSNWRQPTAREHPLGQELQIGVWAVACLGCHDSAAARAHAESQTSPSSGAEACAICHAEGEVWSVELYHDTR
jgi:OmcA/MtrC family decaheme c-type cytochrome